jgi:DNA-binding beta-propeller fold protein YncE
MSQLSEYRLTGRAKPSGLGARLISATAILLACWLPLGAQQGWAADAPLVLEKTIPIPGVPLGPYTDHMALDLVGGRLFASPQAAKAIAVLDWKDGRVLKMIPVGNPHGLYFSPTLKRLFVTDGATGDLVVFSTEDYSVIKRITLLLGADALVYDPQTQLLYVTNGGDHAKMNHAIISAVDITRMEKVADISVTTAGDLEAAVVDSDKQMLYVNLYDDSAVAVVNLKTRQQVGTWKLPEGIHYNIGMEIDAAHSRLYVASRDTSVRGSVIVLDTANGNAVATLPIGGWADGITVDQKRKRFYVSAGVGQIDTYTIEANDVYHRQPTVDTAVLAKTSLYSKDLDRMFVSVPTLGAIEAQVMVFKPLP